MGFSAKNRMALPASHTRRHKTYGIAHHRRKTTGNQSSRSLCPGTIPCSGNGGRSGLAAQHSGHHHQQTAPKRRGGALHRHCRGRHAEPGNQTPPHHPVAWSIRGCPSPLRRGREPAAVLIRIELIPSQPAHRQHRALPQMRAGDTAQRGITDRINRRPETHRLSALDEIIGAVLVPWRWLRCSRFLHQYMIMKICTVRDPIRSAATSAAGDRWITSRNWSIRCQLQ